ncbi:MAG: hypothetical protein K5899_09830, partial [Bacteroidaceae bacterium]|nr:hypothetical protein [Bacteroidaceae bacterium]
MKRTFLVLLVLFATLFATAQDFTTEMKEDTTHYNPVCVANDTIYWSQMSKWRAYYLQKRAPVWKLSEKDSKNFDAKTRTFAADPRTTAMQVDLIRYVLQQIGNKKLKALIKENPKAFVLVSLFINKEGNIDNTMITFSCDHTTVGNETIYNLLKNVKSKFNFPHYRELKDSYPYPNGETQVSFP